MGKSWDYCTGEEKRTCFTGKKYIVCPESVPKSPISKHKRTKKERILDRELATIGLIGQNKDSLYKIIWYKIKPFFFYF